MLLLITKQIGLAEDKKELPKPMPDNIVKAWKDAGAVVGRMRTEATGVLTFIEKPEPGSIPAFRFLKWKDGIVAKLPVPEAPFGLSLCETEVLDAGLNELAKLKNLSSLCLCDTKVTGAGVEKLQKAFPKCLIFHC